MLVAEYFAAFLQRAVNDLATRARDKKLKPEEVQGGTFTITNVGPLGGTALIPTINYPEVAILGMGRAQEKPVVRNGEIVISDEAGRERERRSGSHEGAIPMPL